MHRRGTGKLGKRRLCCFLAVLALLPWALREVRAQSVPRIRLKARAACPEGMLVPGPAPIPLAGSTELTAHAVVEQVLARNPTLEQMVAAWQAAEARYPQVTSLDDPMFNRVMAPASAFSRQVGFAYRLELSQKLSWPGKRQLRGQGAKALAAAAGCEAEDVRLQLVESARSAYYDYFLVSRALEVNDEAVFRLARFKQAAEGLRSKPPAGRVVSPQDALQADVEIGRRQERRLMLERVHEVAVARLNTLMHLPPDTPLPPPPRQLSVNDGLPDVTALRGAALSQRPDLRALASRVAAAQAAEALARREFYPDSEVMVAYDGFWQAFQRPLDWQVGVRMNLPVQRSRRHAALEEARARLAQHRAELAHLADQVQFEVQQAHALVRESARAIQLYERQLLGQADRSVQAARRSYEAGQVPAVSVIEAERTRLVLRDRYYESVANYFRRLATLERVTGGPLTPPSNQVACPPR